MPSARVKPHRHRMSDISGLPAALANGGGGGGGTTLTSYSQVQALSGYPTTFPASHDLDGGGPSTVYTDSNLNIDGGAP